MPGLINSKKLCHDVMPANLGIKCLAFRLLLIVLLFFFVDVCYFLPQISQVPRIVHRSFGNKVSKCKDHVYNVQYP